MRIHGSGLRLFVLGSISLGFQLLMVMRMTLPLPARRVMLEQTRERMAQVDMGWAGLESLFGHRRSRRRALRNSRQQ